MESEYPTDQLGNYVKVQGGYAYKSKHWQSSGTPVLKIKNIRAGSVDTSEPAYVSPEVAKETNRYFIKHGDILISMTGSGPNQPNSVVGRVARFIGQDDTFLLNQRVGRFVIEDHNQLDPLFLYFVLNAEEHQRELVLSATGSANQANISGDQIGRLDIPIPSIEEQRAIASILGALNDKIELNRRMNATLESLARAIFKSWFVDFDPVKINAGQLPASSANLDPKLLDLFPSTFQDSELGPIPEGWSVERFADHINVRRGLSYKGAGLADEGVPMHNLNSIYEGGGYKHEGIKYYTGEYRDRHEVTPGDLIATNTEQGFEHRLIGCAALVPKRYGDKGIYSHHIYRIRMEEHSSLSPHYMLRLINSSRWHSWIAGFSNGTTINMLPTDALEMPLLVVPPAELVQRFTELARNISDEIEDSILESESLARTRDELLPRLLSGELPVDELLTEQ